MARRILFPMDFTEGSERVLPSVVDLARQLGADLHIVHVVPQPHQLDPFFRPGLTPARSVASIRERAGARLADLLRKSPAPYRLRVVDGEPAAAILASTERLRPDLVVVAMRARRGLARCLLGSVAIKVIRGCAAPVLTLRMPAGSVGR